MMTNKAKAPSDFSGPPKKITLFILASLLLMTGQSALAQKTGQIAQAKERRNTALHVAAYHKENVERIQQMVFDGLGHYVHIRNTKGLTPLHVAAWRHPNPQVLEIFLDAGADVNARDDRNRTPLFWSSHSTNPQKIVPVLLDAGADVRARTKKDGITALHAAVINSPFPKGFIETLVREGAEVDAKNNDGRTPLHFIVLSKKPKIAALALLRARADVRLKDKFGKTPADYAREKNLPADIIEMLK